MEFGGTPAAVRDRARMFSACPKPLLKSPNVETSENRPAWMPLG